MKVREVMTSPVIQIQPAETVAVAARILTRYNVGVLPVCGADGTLKGIVTDRDLVTRCMASGRRPEETTVSEVMTPRLVTADADMSTQEAARLMGHQQVRRLPVVSDGKLCGMVGLSDLEQGTAEAFRGITSGVSDR